MASFFGGILSWRFAVGSSHENHWASIATVRDFSGISETLSAASKAISPIPELVMDQDCHVRELNKQNLPLDYSSGLLSSTSRTVTSL